MSNSSIWPIDRTIPDATIPGLSGAGSDGNKYVLAITQSPSITQASPSDCLVSYPGHSLWESYLSDREVRLPQRVSWDRADVFYSTSRQDKAKLS